MTKPGHKAVAFAGTAQTLTTAFVVTALYADTSDYTESTIYIQYTPSTTLNVLHSKLQFTNDGTNWHDEPDETVSAGVATVIGKTRVFVATGGVAELVPVISMPVADRAMRILVKEVLTGGGAHGTVIINGLISKLE